VQIARGAQERKRKASGRKKRKKKGKWKKIREDN